MYQIINYFIGDGMLDGDFDEFSRFYDALDACLCIAKTIAAAEYTDPGRVEIWIDEENGIGGACPAGANRSDWPMAVGGDQND